MSISSAHSLYIYIYNASTTKQYIMVKLTSGNVCLISTYLVMFGDQINYYL